MHEDQIDDTQATPAQTAVADAKTLFANLEFEYLIELQAELTKHIARRQDQSRREAAEKIRKLAAAAGLTEEDLMSLAEGKGVKPTKSAALAKYANPADKSQTWSGLGRRPAWVIAHLESGKPIEDLAL